MGAWVSCVLAMMRPERVSGIVGVCPGFGTELYHLITKEYGTAGVRSSGNSCGFNFDVVGNDYTYITSPVDVSCPVRLYHAYTDEVVKWQTSQSLLNNLPEDCDAKLIYTRSGNHAMSRDEDFEVILALVRELRQK